MALFLANLDDTTRRYMVEELDHDIAGGALYVSTRLNTGGQAEYPGLLRAAFTQHNDNWLAAQINRGLLNTMESRRTPSGGVTSARVPVTAAETMAEGEFNRFYARGLCRRALAEGIAQLVVYRAKAVQRPRMESEAKIGSRIDCQALLDDLRSHPGMDTALGLPSGPNSGLSVKLPE